MPVAGVFVAYIAIKNIANNLFLLVKYAPNITLFR